MKKILGLILVAVLLGSCGVSHAHNGMEMLRNLMTNQTYPTVL